MIGHLAKSRAARSGPLSHYSISTKEFTPHYPMSSRTCTNTNVTNRPGPYLLLSRDELLSVPLLSTMSPPSALWGVCGTFPRVVLASCLLVLLPTRILAYISHLRHASTSPLFLSPFKPLSYDLMLTSCSLHAHLLLSSCSPLAHLLLTSCSSLAHLLLIVCLRFVHILTISCSLVAHLYLAFPSQLAHYYLASFFLILLITSSHLAFSSLLFHSFVTPLFSFTRLSLLSPLTPLSHSLASHIPPLSL